MAVAAARLRSPDVALSELLTPHGRVTWARLGHGSPVLVLHGSGGGWDQGVDWARRRLGRDGDAEVGHDVVAVSRFGYPGSDLPPDATPAEQSEVLTALLDHLGLGAVDVVALSAGSAAALRLAVDHPDRVRRLVLESPVLPVRGRPALPPAFLAPVLARAQRALWFATSRPVLVRLAAGVPAAELDDAGRAELAAVNATMFPLAPRAAGLVFDRVVAVPEVLEDRIPVERISAPTLVVNAARAVLAPHEDAVQFVSRVPGAELLELDRGGHLLVGNVARLRAVLAEALAA